MVVKKAEKKPKVTLRTLSEMLDMNASTISLALSGHPRVNPDTQRRVATLAAELGYRTLPQPVDRKKTLHRIGILSVGQSAQIDSQILTAFVAEADKLNCRVEVCLAKPDSDPSTVVERARRFAAELDGICLTDHVDDALLAGMAKLGKPYVVLGDVYDAGKQIHNYPQVSFDATAMGREATRWLAQRHQRIALFTPKGPKGLFIDRYCDGYRLGLADAGIAFDEALCYVRNLEDMDPEAAVASFLALPEPPTAYVLTGANKGLLNFLEARDCLPGTDALVLTGPLEAAKERDMEHYPRLEADWAPIAEVALAMLERGAARGIMANNRTIVPHKRHNLSW